MSEIIHVCTGANERFMIGATAAFVGIAIHAQPETRLHFHIFTEGVKPETVSFMRSILMRYHAQTILEEHICDEKLLAGLPYWAGSRLSAARVFYPYLMKDVDWALYVDCDLLYFASPEEHYAFRDESVYACVTQEEHSLTRHEECQWSRLKCHVDIPDDQYFNAGVMLFNLKKCREDRIPDKVQAFYREYPDVKLPDQTAMNVLFHGHKKMLPGKFDRLGMFISDDKLKEFPVLHYVGGNPWSPKAADVENHRMRMWHSFCDRFIWEKNGESYARTYSLRQVFLKRLLYWILVPPFFGNLFADFCQAIGLSPDGRAWRAQQIAHDVSQRAAVELLDRTSLIAQEHFAES